MPHPNFFGFRSRPGRVRSDGSRRPAVLPPNHASARLRFPSAPRLGFEHDSDRICGVPCQIGASQPRNVVGEGLGWVEHSHPKSPNITEPHRLHFSGCISAYLFRTPRRALRPKAARPVREGPRMVQKALPGRFTPNCGDSTISVGRSLGLAHDCGGRGVQCGSASDPVTARDRVEGGHRGWWGV